jgi:hypothetical protein
MNDSDGIRIEGFRQMRQEIYNTPQKLDRGLRWIVARRNSKEERQDGKEAQA